MAEAGSLRLFPLILVSVFLITACSDNDPDIRSNFIIGEKTYALDKGYAYLDGVTEVNGVKTYTWVVYLLSESIVAENRDFNGSGNAVVFTSSDYTFTMTFSITLSGGAIVKGTYKGSV